MSTTAAVVAGVAFRTIPAGVFLMGAPDAERELVRAYIDTDWWREGVDAEGPAHRVEIGRSFDLGAFPVTVAQFRQFVEATGYRTDGEREGTGAYRWVLDRGKWELNAECTWRHPGFEQDDQRPVVCVSWNDATAFCSWFCTRAGRRCRLPTEAEWEYACRAGTTTPFHTGQSLSSDAANFDGTRPNEERAGAYLQRTSAVGSYPPNGFGLCDMHGNVYEWCSDWFDQSYYVRSPQRDPRGPDHGTERVVRGGAWNTVAVRCRSACRKSGWPDFRINRRGFRVVVERD